MTPDPKVHSTALRRRGILDEEDLQELQNEARMSIDIDRLSEAELIDLNHRIVARLRLLHQMRAHADMLEFRIGDRVTFQPPDQPQIEGMLTRYNKKTVTVITDAGERWNISLQLLTKAVAAASPPDPQGKVIQLHRS